MMNWCNSYRTDGKRNDCYYHILAMAAYSNERVAAIVVSVLYRMLTEKGTFIKYYKISQLIHTQIIAN